MDRTEINGYVAMTTESGELSFPETDTAKHGKRFTDEQRRIAFWAWSSKCGRNASETARWLASPQAAHLEFPPVEARTIRNWAIDGDWAALADKELHEAVPQMRFRTQIEVNQGQLEAVRFLRQVVDASEELATDVAIKVKVSRDEERIEIVRQIDWNGVKARILAASALTGMAGLSPVGSRAVGDVMAPPSLLDDVKRNIDTASPDELAEIERATMERIRKLRS